MVNLTPADLAALGGLHSYDEGMLLRDLAMFVPAHQAIVEVGTYTGASALWMASGAGAGRRARVTCVDTWPDPRPDEPDVAHAERQRQALGTFLARMAEHDWPVTALRGTSADVAAMWLQPIGLLFIDADHSFRAVVRDYSSWSPLIAPGGWLAMHDYLGDDLTDQTDVAEAVRRVIVPTGLWGLPRMVGKMWCVERLP